LENSKESVIASKYLYGDVADENALPERFKKALGSTGLKLTLLDIKKKEINQSNELYGEDAAKSEDYGFIIKRNLTDW